MARVMTCTYCGEKGHNKRGCPKRKKDNEQGNVVKLHPVHSIKDVCVDVNPVPNTKGIEDQISMMLRLQEDTMKLLKFMLRQTMPAFHKSDIPYSMSEMETMTLGALRVIATQWLSEDQMPWQKHLVIAEIAKRREYETHVLRVSAKYNLSLDQASCAILIADNLGCSVQEALGLV